MLRGRKRKTGSSGGEYVVKSIYIPKDKLPIWKAITDNATKSNRSASEIVLLALEAYSKIENTN